MVGRSVTHEASRALRQSRKALECVLVDLSTQHDFLDEAGACRVHNATMVLPSWRRVVAWARRNQVPVISAMDTHRPQELPTDGFPVHCIDGSPGHRKVEFTMLPSRLFIEFDNTFSVPLDPFQSYQQVIFRKRSRDLLANPKADRFLTQLLANEFVAFGSGVEYSVKALVLGLLARSKRVTVVRDACGFWNRTEAELSLRQMEAKGATLITVEELMRRKLKRPIRYPSRHILHTGNGNGNGNGQHAPDGNGERAAPVNGNSHAHAPGNGSAAAAAEPTKLSPP
ncbi:MAG TPA: isochorismatase family protein [Phycisphaerae bacterium]